MQSGLASRSSSLLSASSLGAWVMALLALVPALGLAQQPSPCKGSADTVPVTQASVVYIIGAVKHPCWYSLRAGEAISVSQALALVGGLTETAKASSAKIIHSRGEESLSETSLDLKKTRPSALQDIELGGGDILIVPDSRRARANPNLDTPVFALPNLW